MGKYRAEISDSDLALLTPFTLLVVFGISLLIGATLFNARDRLGTVPSLMVILAATALFTALASVPFVFSAIQRYRGKLIRVEPSLHDASCHHKEDYGFNCSVYTNEKLLVHCGDPPAMALCTIDRKYYCVKHWHELCLRNGWEPGISRCLNEFIDRVGAIKNNPLSEAQRKLMIATPIILAAYLDEPVETVRKHIY